MTAERAQIAELYGLVLSGGRSRRMQRDKAALRYAGTPQLVRATELLAPRLPRVCVSVRQEQLCDPLRGGYETIADLLPDLGPIGGIHAALHTHPDKAWLILACDLPFLDGETLQQLIARRDPTRLATAYRSHFDGLPEPLCAIFEPASRPAIVRWIEQGERCPRKFLTRHDVRLLELTNPRALDNINTPEEYAAAQLGPSAPEPMQPGEPPPATEPRRVQVRYFALLREQAGRSSEEVETSAGTALELYEELRRRRGLGLEPQRLRVAVNDEFSDWHIRLRAGDSVAFLPPVAGG